MATTLLQCQGVKMNSFHEYKLKRGKIDTRCSGAAETLNEAPSFPSDPLGFPKQPLSSSRSKKALYSRALLPSFRDLGIPPQSSPECHESECENVQASNCKINNYKEEDDFMVEEEGSDEGGFVAFTPSTRVALISPSYRSGPSEHESVLFSSPSVSAVSPGVTSPRKYKSSGGDGSSVSFSSSQPANATTKAGVAHSSENHISWALQKNGLSQDATGSSSAASAVMSCFPKTPNSSVIMSNAGGVKTMSWTSACQAPRESLHSTANRTSYLTDINDSTVRLAGDNMRSLDGRRSSPKLSSTSSMSMSPARSPLPPTSQSSLIRSPYSPSVSPSYPHIRSASSPHTDAVSSWNAHPSSSTVDFNTSYPPLNMERLWAGDRNQLPQPALNLSKVGMCSSDQEGDETQPMICMICDDKATGLHYGIITCEGCKGFFKRTVQGKRVYNCVADGKCEVTKSQRNRCQYCRFWKCLRMGMVIAAVREDRMPGGRNSGSVYNLYNKVKYKKKRNNKGHQVQEGARFLQNGRYPDSVSPIYENEKFSSADSGSASMQGPAPLSLSPVSMHHSVISSSGASFHGGLLSGSTMKSSGQMQEGFQLTPKGKYSGVDSVISRTPTGLGAAPHSVSPVYENERYSSGDSGIGGSVCSQMASPRSLSPKSVGISPGPPVFPGDLPSNSILKAALLNTPEVAQYRSRAESAVSSSRDRTLSLSSAKSMVESIGDFDIFEDYSSLQKLNFIVSDKMVMSNRIVQLGDTFAATISNWVKSLPFMGEVISLESLKESLTRKWRQLLILSTTAYRAMYLCNRMGIDGSDAEYKQEIDENLRTLQQYLGSMDDITVTIDSIRQSLGVLTEKLTLITMSLRQLEIQTDEYHCMNVIILLNGALQNNPEIHSLKQQYISCLRTLSESENRGSSRNRVKDLLVIIKNIEEADALLIESKLTYIPFFLCLSPSR